MATDEPKTGEDKKKRKRNKQLLRSIRHQVEFYFSDANLRKDRFLQQEISHSQDRYVEVATIASFNGMKTLCPDAALIPQALSSSDLVELSEDKSKIRRKTPLGEPEFDPDDVTVYVECLPKTVDHEWLRKVFGVCGSVEYVSLPRYKSTGDVKGFAFIEFKTPEEANRACQMLHNPPDEDASRIGKFPKTKGRRYVPIEENSDESEAASGHLEEASKTGRKRSHGEDGDRHGESHKSHKRKHHESESSEGNAVAHEHLEESAKISKKRSHDKDSDRHGESHKSYKRKHHESESSDGNPVARVHLEEATKSGKKKSHDEDGSRHGESHKSHKRKHHESESSDGISVAHDHREEATKTGKRLHDEDGDRHGESHKSHRRKHRESESSDGNPVAHDHREEATKKGKRRSHDEDGDRHGESHKSHKRKHESELSDGKPDSGRRDIKKKRHHSDEASDSSAHHSLKKHKHESKTQHKEADRPDAESVEKEHKRKHEDTKENEVGEKKSSKKDTSSQDSKGKESHESRKRKHTDDEEDHGGRKNKEDEVSSESKKSKDHNVLPADVEPSAQQDEGQAKKESDNEDKSKRKRVRKKKQEKKKKESKENDLQLRVISKREWLDLKQQYLSLQKASLTKMKQALRRAMVADTTKDDTAEKVVKSSEPEFTPGVVLKIETKKPIDSRKQLKDDLQVIAPVAYVDLQPGDQTGFVRCESTDGATQILNKYGPNVTGDNITVSLLTGDDEKQYWEKLRADRNNKLSSKQKKKKKRGVDRVSLLCKAEKVTFASLSVEKSSHIHFDDNE